MPFNGQGAAQAIEDANTLDVLFANLHDVADVKKLFRVFDQVRRARTQEVVDIAREFGLLFHYALPGFDDNVEKMKEFFSKASSFTNDLDIQEQNQQAIKLFRDIELEKNRYIY